MEITLRFKHHKAAAMAYAGAAYNMPRCDARASRHRPHLTELAPGRGADGQHILPRADACAAAQSRLMC